MPTASKDHIGSRQPQTHEQFVGDVLGQQLKEKGASTQPLERATSRKGVDKALHPGEITTNEAEIWLLWVQLRVIQVRNNRTRQRVLRLLAEILVERQGKGRGGLGVLVERNVRERLRVAPSPFGFCRDCAPVLLQQNRQRSDRPSPVQPALEIAGEELQQSVVGSISYLHLIKRLREEHLLTHWAQG